jgi:hypothetical protein
MAGSGLAHYVKADELLAETEASPAISNETETSHADPGRRSRGSCWGGCHRAELVWSR